MRKTAIAMVMSLSLLGGCAGTQITDFLGKVQADAAAACAFIPTVDTVLAVATALGIPWGTIAGAAINTIANVICSQIPPPASAQYRSLNTQRGPAKTAAIYNGVPINGWRLR